MDNSVDTVDNLLTAQDFLFYPQSVDKGERWGKISKIQQKVIKTLQLSSFCQEEKKKSGGFFPPDSACRKSLF